MDKYSYNRTSRDLDKIVDGFGDYERGIMLANKIDFLLVLIYTVIMFATGVCIGNLIF